MSGRRKNRKDGAASLRGRAADSKGYRLGDFTCETHGKWSWVNRKDAKRAISHMRHNGDNATRMREYACDVSGHWHVGHTPPDVVAGIVSMAEAKATMNRRDKRRADGRRSA